MMYLEASKAQVPFMNIYFTKLQGYRKHPGDIMSEAEKEESNKTQRYIIGCQRH